MSSIYEALEKAEQKRTVTSIKEKEIEKPRLMKEAISLPTRRFDVPSFPLFQTGSLAAEQFRKLRTFITKLKPMNTIMVTSATQGEGKSFVSANLAVGIAYNLDHHALLVECDLRKPSLCNHFEICSGMGLSDYLKGKEFSHDFLTKTKLDKLTLLQAGSLKENPAELIDSKKMKTLIEEMKTRYSDRYIIFDSTPILVTAEAEILAQMVDGIILVIQSGKTPRETIQRAIRAIGKDKLLGVVLNKIEFKSSGLFSRYFGSNDYYYHNSNGNGNGNGKRTEPNRWKSLFSGSNR